MRFQKQAADRRGFPRIQIHHTYDPCLSAQIRGCEVVSRLPTYCGCFVTRRYGLIVLNPGNFCCASSFETAAVMITSSPCFQFTGVATLCFAVSCMESSTRR